MKEILNLTPRQAELVVLAGGTPKTESDYTETEIVAIINHVMEAFSANSDSEGTPNELGLEFEALLDFFEVLPVQLESMEDCYNVLAQEIDLVFRYDARIFLLEHTKKGIVLMEKGRMSTRKTFADAKSALEQFQINGQALQEIVLQVVIIDLMLTEEAIAALEN